MYSPRIKSCSPRIKSCSPRRWAEASRPVGLKPCGWSGAGCWKRLCLISPACSVGCRHICAPLAPALLWALGFARLLFLSRSCSPHRCEGGLGVKFPESRVSRRRRRREPWGDSPSPCCGVRAARLREEWGEQSGCCSWWERRVGAGAWAGLNAGVFSDCFPPPPPPPHPH